jgi:light-regulated signal transduction histidine kinase (bacteriophytochrome)
MKKEWPSYVELKVSKNLVEANGGSIEVESEKGKGSTLSRPLFLDHLQRSPPSGYSYGCITLTPEI